MPGHPVRRADLARAEEASRAHVSELDELLLIVEEDTDASDAALERLEAALLSDSPYCGCSTCELREGIAVLFRELNLELVD